MRTTSSTATLKEGDYHIVTVNDELVIQIKREIEGYVVDAYKPDKHRNYDDEVIESMCIWNDILLEGQDELD